MSPAVYTRSKTRASEAERFLTAEACRALLARVEKLCTGGGETALGVRSRWRGNLRWARNSVITGGDMTTHEIVITRRIKGMEGSATTNAIDGPMLLDGVRRAEEQLRISSPRDYNEEGMRAAETYAHPHIWSDATFGVDAVARGAAQRKLVEPVLAAQLMSAGYLEVTAMGTGVMNSAGLFAYMPETRAEYSVTVRDRKGTGSGWAGIAHRDWTQIQPEALTARALDKCQRSMNPVAIEPGRYTVILEPQAVAELMLRVVWSLGRTGPEVYNTGPWATHPDPNTLVVPDIVIGGGTVQDGGVRRGAFEFPTKITQRVLDPRITISADPADPEAGFLPFMIYDSTPMRAVTWINQGVLKQLSYSRYYGERYLNKSDPLNNSNAFRMSGGTTTIPEMIASTERGLLVTRLVNLRPLDIYGPSLLQGGTTADGLWLIEHGKITTPVKNFRFRESPLYAFNNLESLGVPMPVLLEQPALVPPAKILDFSMTSLADAI